MSDIDPLKARLDNVVFGPLFNALLHYQDTLNDKYGLNDCAIACTINEPEFVDYLKVNEGFYNAIDQVSLEFLVSDLFTHLVQTDYAHYIGDRMILPSHLMREIAAMIGWEPMLLNPEPNLEVVEFKEKVDKLRFFELHLKLNFNLKGIDLSDVDLGLNKHKLLVFCYELIGEEAVNKNPDLIRSATTINDLANILILLA